MGRPGTSPSPSFLYVEEIEWAQAVAVSVAPTFLQAYRRPRGNLYLVFGVYFRYTALLEVSVSEEENACRGYREKQSILAEWLSRRAMRVAARSCIPCKMASNNQFCMICSLTSAAGRLLTFLPHKTNRFPGMVSLTNTASQRSPVLRP